MLKPQITLMSSPTNEPVSLIMVSVCDSINEAELLKKVDAYTSL